MYASSYLKVINKVKYSMTYILKPNSYLHKMFHNTDTYALEIHTLSNIIDIDMCHVCCDLFSTKTLLCNLCPVWYNQ